MKGEMLLISITLLAFPFNIQCRFSVCITGYSSLMLLSYKSTALTVLYVCIYVVEIFNKKIKLNATRRPAEYITNSAQHFV